MQKSTATSMLESLASGVRLDVFRLLVRKGPEGMVAGAIASELELPPTNLSFHLKALTQSGLLQSEQEGRYQRYRADVAAMSALIVYLTEECCADRSERCELARVVPLCRQCAEPLAGAVPDVVPDAVPDTLLNLA